LTLLPSSAPPALSVAWTLVHEMLFYVIFSLFFVSRRLLWIVCTLWGMTIAAIYAGGLGHEWRYLLSPLNLCFLLGVSLYYFTRERVPASVGVTALILGLVTLAVQSVQTDPSRILIAMGFSGLIVCAVSSFAKGIYPGRWLLMGGAASYAIYLIHNPAQSIFIRLVSKDDAVTPLVAFGVVAVASICMGLIYHFWYERYALRVARKLFSGFSNRA
jgi:exopolysaccharide production protein ExoZ